MKYCFLCCFLLLISCGSPLDEGYWKEYNEEEQINDDTGEETRFRIDLEALHDFTIEFSSQVMKKLVDGRITVSAEISFPNAVTLQSYRIESTPCSSIDPLNYNLTTNEKTSSFDFTGDLNEITNEPSLSIEGRYLYLYGSWSGQVSTRIACSEITL